MKDFDEILTQLKTDLTANLPALLDAESLSDFDEYDYGPAEDANKLGLYIYMAPGNSDYYQNNFTVIIELQLYNIDELAKAKYGKVVYKYMSSYNPANIGMVGLENVSWESWPIEENSSSFFYVIPTWKEELDSCDSED